MTLLADAELTSTDGVVPVLSSTCTLKKYFVIPTPIRESLTLGYGLTTLTSWSAEGKHTEQLPIEIERDADLMGVKVNESKIKYMLASRNDSAL